MQHYCYRRNRIGKSIAISEQNVFSSKEFGVFKDKMKKELKKGAEQVHGIFEEVVPAINQRFVGEEGIFVIEGDGKNWTIND